MHGGVSGTGTELSGDDVTGLTGSGAEPLRDEDPRRIGPGALQAERHDHGPGLRGHGDPELDADVSPFTR
ncbi:hypothetical protein GCM10010250_43650 [Streptomyces althioticus]|nr:hypothetical protein GCM10010250_43650 [Streptomyces althioticus]GGT75807.1 hypothetical protein GCM10010243_63080 [Streptomyces matensis]